MTADRTTIIDLIYTSCVLLDEKKYEEWMALCTPDFRYMITAYSEEIRKDMIWRDLDLEELSALFKDLPTHIVMPGGYRRHAGVCREVGRTNGRVNVETSVIVYHTDLQGASKLFAVTKYLDEVAADGDRVLLANRQVRMETRRLDFGPSTVI